MDDIHTTCPSCGAAAYGNAYCATCRAHWPSPAEEDDT